MDIETINFPLRQLPPEIFQRVLFHLSQASIISLSKTCRALKQQCYSKLYGNIYIIVSTYCRSYEFTVTKKMKSRMTLSQNFTVISGLLSLSKFVTHTLPTLRTFVTKLYVDFLSFDKVLNPRIFDLLFDGPHAGDPLDVRDFDVPNDKNLIMEDINSVQKLFLRHFFLRLKEMDGYQVEYFKDIDNPLSFSGDLISYSTVINYEAMIIDLNEVIDGCERALVLDYRTYEAWPLLQHKVTQKTIHVHRAHYIARE